MKTIISCLFFLLTGCASVLTQPESQEIMSLLTVIMGTVLLNIPIVRSKKR